MSSLSFLGNSTSYLIIPKSDALNFGTGDFTIEWYQYQTDSNPYPRIFQVGSYNEGGISIGVVIERDNLYYWANGNYIFVTFLPSSSYKNKWVHFAICRLNSVTNFYMDGVSIFSQSDTNNFNDLYDLCIANQSTPLDQGAFGGYIAYFTWVKGSATYTSNFTVSNNYPTLTNNHALLLKANSFNGSLGNTVVNNNVSTISNVPPNFLSNNVNNNNTNNTNNSNSNNLNSMYNTNVHFGLRILPKKSIFTNNTVFYRKGSLASGGVGGVRNSSAKSRRT